MTHKLIAMAVACSAAASLFADAEKINDIEWTYTVSDGKAVIAGVKDEYRGWIPAIRSLITPVGEVIGAITIPSSLGGYPVATIGSHAFYFCDDITRVTIPDGVTSICDSAFASCHGLARVTIPASVMRIDSTAFYNSSAAIYDTSTIPGVKLVDGWVVGYTEALSGALDLSGVRGIADNAFLNCRSLTEVTIPNGIKSIAARTFSGCSNLARVTIPDSVACIGEFAFYGCSRLASVKIPDGVTRIEMSTFSGCSGLTSMTIPDSVMDIGSAAFRNCRGIASMDIPDNVTSIGDKAFSGCVESLFDMVTIPGVKLVDGWVVGFTDDIPANLDLVGVRGIGDLAFYKDGQYDGPGLVNVTMSDSVVSIGDYAFWFCKGLKNVAIPDSVKTIRHSAFDGCNDPVNVLMFGKPSSDDALLGYNVSVTYAIVSVLPAVGDYVLEGATKISASCDVDGVVLLYTTDGSDPTIDSPVFSPFTVRTSLTVKIGAFYHGVRMAVKTTRFWLGEVQPLQISVNGNLSFTGDQSRRVTINCGTAEANVRYTLDGSEPTEESPLYSGPFDVVPAAGETVTIRARAFKDGWRPSDEATQVALTRRWTIGDSLGAPEQTFVTGGRAAWTRSRYGYNGCEAMRSGKIVDGASCWLKTTVPSSGVVSFWWKTSCEQTDDVESPWDHIEFSVDGKVVAWIDGESEWEQVEYNISGDGEHVLLWTYVKDASDSRGQDCAWVSRFAWVCDGYTINFHRNDASDEKTEAYEFDYGVRMRLPTLNSMGWARRGFDFLGWAKSTGNAARGTIWAADWGIVSTAAEIGETRDVYASWALKDGFYAIQFIRNDGAGTWRTVGFPYGEKTRMPTLANGLGWGRRGYQFNGWAQTAANANNGVIWKGDWGYVATPVAAGSTLMVYASWTLKPGYYQIRFNKNDGSGKWRTLGFECGASAKLNTIAGLGWEIPGKTFKGWASNKANADAGKVWKTDGAWLKDATAEGKTLSIYAVWE